MMFAPLLSLLLAVSPPADPIETERAAIAQERAEAVPEPRRAEYVKCLSRMQSVASDWMIASTIRSLPAGLNERRQGVVECMTDLRERTRTLETKSGLNDVFEMYLAHMEEPSAVGLSELIGSIGRFTRSLP